MQLLATTLSELRFYPLGTFSLCPRYLNWPSTYKIHLNSIKCSYYFTESTLRPNYKERSIIAEYEKSGCLSSESKHNVWAKYSYLMLRGSDRCALGVWMLKAHDSAVSSTSQIQLP